MVKIIIFLYLSIYLSRYQLNRLLLNSTVGFLCLLNRNVIASDDALSIRIGRVGVCFFHHQYPFDLFLHAMRVFKSAPCSWISLQFSFKFLSFSLFNNCNSALILGNSSRNFLSRSASQSRFHDFFHYNSFSS